MKKRRVQRIVAVYPVVGRESSHTFLIRAANREGKHFGWYVHHRKDELEVWMWARRQLSNKSVEQWMWEWRTYADGRYPDPEETTIQEAEDA